MNKNELINWNYYEGKSFNELDKLAKAILGTLQFDWIMRPTSPDTRLEYKHVWRFGRDDLGYLLEADMSNPKKALEIIQSGHIKAYDVLRNLTSPFRICDDEVNEHEGILGEYKG